MINIVIIITNNDYNGRNSDPTIYLNNQWETPLCTIITVKIFVHPLLNIPFQLIK